MPGLRPANSWAQSRSTWSLSRWEPSWTVHIAYLGFKLSGWCNKNHLTDSSTFLRIQKCKVCCNEGPWRTSIPLKAAREKFTFLPQNTLCTTLALQQLPFFSSEMKKWIYIWWSVWIGVVHSSLRVRSKATVKAWVSKAVESVDGILLTVLKFLKPCFYNIYAQLIRMFDPRFLVPTSSADFICQAAKPLKTNMELINHRFELWKGHPNLPNLWGSMLVFRSVNSLKCSPPQHQ